MGIYSDIPNVEFLKEICMKLKEKERERETFKGFPGGPVAENLPASAGDMGSIPDPGRSHMLWNN